MVCRYPDVFKHARRDYIPPETPSPRQVVKLSETPTIYSSDDMQLFHHYLISAHPCIPHDWNDIWVRDIPVKANQVCGAFLSQYKLRTQKLVLHCNTDKGQSLDLRIPSLDGLQLLKNHISCLLHLTCCASNPATWRTAFWSISCLYEDARSFPS